MARPDAACPCLGSSAAGACLPRHALLQGLLFPYYHGAYWIGLKASSWPLFSWIDPATPGLNTPKAYKNWGFQDGQVNPNGQPGVDMCAVASFAEPKPGSQGWGWSDTSCTNRYVTICKTRRKCLSAIYCASAALLVSCVL